MSTRYTREQLVGMGMDEAQINAILSTYEKEGNNTDNVVSMAQHKPVAGPGEVIPVNCNDAMKITSVADLQSYANGTIVRFPDFGDGQPFVAKVRRPSMLVLAKEGKIPNSLLATASELFTKGGEGIDTDNEHILGDMYDIMHVICEASLIQPTMQDIEGAGMSLSDNQLMAIFNYTQSGVKALDSFR